MGLMQSNLYFFADFNGICFFSTDFQKILNYQIVSRSVEWEPSWSMRIDRRMGRQTDNQMDMTKLIAAFRSFANAPKMKSVRKEVYVAYSFLTEELNFFLIIAG